MAFTQWPFDKPRFEYRHILTSVQHHLMGRWCMRQGRR
jgi:hypothetical protein